MLSALARAGGGRLARAALASPRVPLPLAAAAGPKFISTALAATAPFASNKTTTNKPNFLLLAGLGGGALYLGNDQSGVADCAPKRKAAKKPAAPKPAAKKKRGPTLTPLEEAAAAAKAAAEGAEEATFAVNKIDKEEMRSGVKWFHIKWDPPYNAVNFDSWEPEGNLEGCETAIAEFRMARDAANRVAAEAAVAARKAREAQRAATNADTGGTSSETPPPPPPPSGGRTSKVYQKFIDDPANPSSRGVIGHCLCQSTETKTKAICGARIKSYPSSLWHHLQNYHPTDWQV